MERMSDLEALFWNLEKDPHLGSSFANVTFLDRPPDVERFRRRMRRALVLVPRLRQRVVPGFGRLAPPAWHDADDVDLAWHVRHVSVPEPGDERAVLDLAVTLGAEPFDRTRPLWRFTVIDGLADGRGALLQQIHHAITDGEGGVRMSAEFLDLTRDADEPPALELPPAEPLDRTLPATLTESLGHAARRNLGLVRRVLEDGAALARHPEEVAHAGQQLVATAASAVRQVAVSDTARSPLWRERTLRRHLEVLRFPLADAKAAAEVLGGSVNDLFVSAVAGGAGAYHRARGADVDELRMAMPISTRTGKAAGGNAFTPTRTLVPVGADPRARFAEIHRRLAATKGEPGLRLAQSAAGIVNLLPTSVVVRFSRQQVETVDFTTSNVRGAPFDLYIAGARIEANYPLGPLAGTAFNATVLSVAGSLDCGIHVDRGAVDDPRALRDAIEASLGELLAFAPGAAPAKARATSNRTAKTKQAAKKQAAKKQAARKAATTQAARPRTRSSRP